MSGPHLEQWLAASAGRETSQSLSHHQETDLMRLNVGDSQLTTRQLAIVWALEEVRQAVIPQQTTC